MATGKYGSASIFFLVDGYNLISNKLKGLRFKHTEKNERTDGLGDSAEEHTPVGVSMIELAQEGAFFDTALNRIHTAMKDAPPTSPQATARIACLGFAGNTLAEPFVGCQGYTESYEPVAQLGALTKANVVHRVSGALDKGLILYPLTTQTNDFTGTTVDGTAQSTNGGVGYLQVTSSFGAFTGVIEHSSDTNTWATLITFTEVTSSPAARRATVSGTVRRYLRFNGTVWGDASASPSLSPSVSASASASATRSASASISPSLSSSASASASRSPSTSLSPSVSASASVSPSSEAGINGTATVFCGFARS